MNMVPPHVKELDEAGEQRDFILSMLSALRLLNLAMLDRLRTVASDSFF